MRPRTSSHRRVASGLLAGALLLAPLTGCGDTSDPDADVVPEETVTESAPAEDTGAPAETSEAEDTGSAGTDGGANADVDCSGTSCSVTFTGEGAEADVLGTAVVLDAVEDGRATLRAGDRELSCTEGESVSAGPLTLTCETVDEDAVTVTADLG